MIDFVCCILGWILKVVCWAALVGFVWEFARMLYGVMFHSDQIKGSVFKMLGFRDDSD